MYSAIILVKNGDQLRLCTRALQTQSIPPKKIILLPEAKKTRLPKLIDRAKTNYIFILHEYFILDPNCAAILINRAQRFNKLKVKVKVLPKKPPFLPFLINKSATNGNILVKYPLVYYVVPQKFKNFLIHYPYWYIFSSAKRLDSIWTVIILDPIAFILTWLIVNFTSITPNQITFLSFILGILSAFFFLQWTKASLIIGAILLILSHLLDCIDGKVARLTNKQSELGSFIDVIKDRIIILLNLLAVSLGSMRILHNKDIFYLSGVALILGSYIRLFTFYYNSSHRAGRLQLHQTSRQQIISPNSFFQRILIFITHFKEALYNKRIKFLPNIYDIEMMMFFLGGLLNQLKEALFVMIVISIFIFIIENTKRIAILINKNYN